jgi:Uma2 family endonuclease
MAVQLARRLFTIDEYDEMVDRGVFKPEERLELINGEIIEMAPIGVRHAGCVTNLTTLFHEQLGRNVVVWAQNPVELPNNSEPQPDVVLLKRRDVPYIQKRPVAEDVLLLVEVSDTTLGYDRDVKLPMYAQSGIPEVWIVNLQEDVIELYSSPSAGAYQNLRRVERGESLTLPGGLNAIIIVNDVLA